MKEAHLYQKLKDSKVKCLNCAHYCVIKNGERGICGVRKNIDGKLYSLVYGKAVAVNIDPIEKKPLFHFLPGTQSLSVATVGCNFKCLYCQNWDISQAPKISERREAEIMGEEFFPAEIVETALKNKLLSISYTYTEPTVFSEYALETMKIAREKDLKNIWVSNGFFSKELLDLITPYLDAANIDLKGFSEEFYRKVCGAKLKPVLDNLKILKEKRIWIEITTLVVPAINDDEKTFENIAKFIKENLGARTPWHISRFSGDISWKLRNLTETPIETLKKAYEIGKEIGLKYVYIGNVTGLPTEDTFCPECETIVINRFGYSIKRYDKNGRCPKCDFCLDIIE